MAECLFINGIVSVKSFKNQLDVSVLTKEKVKPKVVVVSDHLLLCNHPANFENVSVLTKDNRKFVLELKESLMIMRNIPCLSRNVRFAPLYLFDRV